MTNGTYTTKVTTQDGRVFDLGEGQRVPKCGEEKHSATSSCPRCLIVNAWTELVR